MKIEPYLIIEKMSDKVLRAHLLEEALKEYAPNDALVVADNLFKYLRP